MEVEPERVTQTENLEEKMMRDWKVNEEKRPKGVEVVMFCLLLDKQRFVRFFSSFFPQ